MGFLVNITYNLFVFQAINERQPHIRRNEMRGHTSKDGKKKVIVFFKVDFHWTRCKIFLACYWVFTVYVSMNRCKWYCFTLVKHEWGRKEDQAVRCCNGFVFALSGVWILAGQQQEYGRRWRGMTYAVDLTWLIQSHLYWISFFLLLLLCTSQSLVDVTDLSFIYCIRTAVY